MFTSRLARRRRQVGALLAGLCVAAGSVGGAALADSGSGSGTAVSVEASVMVRAGMGPLQARKAAADLNTAIDAAARTMAQAAAAAIQSARPVRTTAAATKAFTDHADAALTAFVIESVTGLKAAGVSTRNLVAGTTAALTQIVRTIPGAVTFTTGAEIRVAGGADGARVSASVNPVLDTALRQTVSDSVRAIRPVLPLSRATLQAVGTGVRQVVDASVAATRRIVRATAEFAAAVVDMTGATLQAARGVAESACTALEVVVTAVRTTLDHLTDVNITAAVDASLKVSAR